MSGIAIGILYFIEYTIFLVEGGGKLVYCHIILVGKAIADKAKALKIETVAFDRGGFLYHGRVKSLAEGAREAGLKF